MFNKIFAMLKNYGILYTVKKVYYRFYIKYFAGCSNYPYNISNELKIKQVNRIFEINPRISIIVPLYNTKELFLSQLIESVLNQTYSDWELCLADASDIEKKKLNKKIIDEYIRKEKIAGKNRIKYKSLKENAGISVNSNAAFEISTGGYIVLLDHDDLLHPSALYEVVNAINSKNADFIYSDELSFVGTPDKVQSINLKTGFAPETLKSFNYICHLCAFERNLFVEAGGFRKEFDGSQDYDLFLRLTSKANNVVHIPKVLYYWRLFEGSVASGAAAKPYTIESGRMAVKNQIEGEGFKAEVNSREFNPTFYQYRYSGKNNVIEKKDIYIVTESDKALKRVEEDLQNSSGVVERYEVHYCDIKDIMEMIIQDKGYSLNSSVYFIKDGFETDSISKNGAWLEELDNCLLPDNNVMAAGNTYSKSGKTVYAGATFECDKAKGEVSIIPLFTRNRRSDTGYMNLTAIRRNTAVAGGVAVAVKMPWLIEIGKEYSLITDIIFMLQETGLKEKVDLFDKLNAVLSLYAYVNARYIVVTADAVLIDDKAINNKMIIKDWELVEKLTESKMGEDEFFNPGMKKLGKYWFVV